MTLFTHVTMAQQVTGSEIDGHVMDQTGAPVPSAQVKATNVDTGLVRAAVADNTGRYALPNLPVGHYRLEVSAPGFKTYVQKGIELQVATNPSIPVTLEVGAVTESVQVTANAAQVETKENSIAQVVDAQRMVDLPLNGRNLTQLLTITGYSTSNMNLRGGDLTGSKNMGGSDASGTFSVAGGAANGVNYLLDGGDNNDAFSNVNLPIPFPDAVQEFNVQTNGLPAQYGLHPGGVVNILTKSGTNAFHGDVFDFLRNGDLNARPKGVIDQQPIRDSLKRNQFGGTIGGPIEKDKLFFFAGYQGTRQRSNPAGRTAYVPTAAALAGDFSVLDGAKSQGGCLANARTLRDSNGNPYPGNRIPVSSFDPAGVKLASAYLPTSPNPCGQYIYGYPANNPDDQIVGRVDYNINSKHSLFGRYFIYDFTGQYLFNGTNALTTSNSGNQERSQTATIGDIYSISPTAVNAFHATFDRRRDNRASTLFSPQDLGVNMFINSPSYTQLSVSNYSGGGFDIGCGTCALANFDINTYQVADDFTLIRGKHQLQFGFDGRKDQFNSYNYQQANGQFTFNGSTSGDGMADLLLGRFSGLTDGNVISDYLRQTVVAAYVQDTFHATRHLTVNLGLRWEPDLAPYDKYGRGDQFSWPLFQQNFHSSVYPDAPAGLVFNGDPQNQYGKALTASHWATFSPRVGLVWDPTGSGKQTIRAAFSMMHDTTELFYPERWTTNPPYVSSISLTSGQFSNPFGNYTLNGRTGDPFPGVSVFPTQGAYISIPPNVPPTYMMQWNISYQRQISTNWIVTANYMGNASRDIWGSTDVNYAVPGPGATVANENQRRLAYLANPAQGQYYSGIIQTDPGGNAEYHALFVSVEHHFAKHYTLLTNYTWSHCVSSWDFTGELAGPQYQNPLNRAGERGSCDWDHRHNFVTTMVIESPGFGTGFSKKLTKDWMLSPIVNLYTGAPFTITDGKDISLTGQGNDRPNVIAPNSVFALPQSNLPYWFNPAAFQCAGSNPACSAFSGQYGNLGRNALYGPGTISWDMNITRMFQLSERWQLQIRSDFFNILNHANWNDPGTTVSSSGTFGAVTSFSTPRIIQMAIKIYF
ncbi:MAG: carboxypeptidase regulatory-like domain-containing protein [Candidatus Sulfopaludibacter sp.]|nr:carboxypeptidase regulatory-like domain-containing protein [Candidatus Sulfopaludibacter sp.]